MTAGVVHSVAVPVAANGNLAPYSIVDGVTTNRTVGGPTGLTNTETGAEVFVIPPAVTDTVTELVPDPLAVGIISDVPVAPGIATASIYHWYAGVCSGSQPLA